MVGPVHEIIHEHQVEELSVYRSSSQWQYRVDRVGDMRHWPRHEIELCLVPYAIGSVICHKSKDDHVYERYFVALAMLGALVIMGTYDVKLGSADNAGEMGSNGTATSRAATARARSRTLSESFVQQRASGKQRLRRAPLL